MTENPKKSPRIKVTKDGPYVVNGGVPLLREGMLIGAEGGPDAWEVWTAMPAPETYALCRCGQSGNKPFCDGSHFVSAFDGTETDRREPYLEAAEKNRLRAEVSHA